MPAPRTRRRTTPAMQASVGRGSPVAGYRGRTLHLEPDSTATIPATPATAGAVTDARPAVIRTIDLTKIYTGSVKAVDTLNLTVFQGEIFGLLGPNGAGKTTTASMLTTRTIPTHGQAFVGDINVVAHPAIAKQLIGWCRRPTPSIARSRSGRTSIFTAVSSVWERTPRARRPTRCWRDSGSRSAPRRR